MPVDTDSVIHNMRVELVCNYKWCILDELNSSQPHHFNVIHHPNSVDVQAYFVMCAWRVDQMVKPILKNFFMNCMEMDFATKAELELWKIETHEQRVWTP